MAIHHHNNTRLKATGLPHRKATGLFLHKATDHHRDILPRTGILRQMDIRTLYLPHSSRTFAKINPDRKVIQAIHLLREDLHHSQAMEGTARHRRSSHQGRTVGDISRYAGFYTRTA